MDTWYRQIQRATNAIDVAIEQGADHQLTLGYLSGTLGYSPGHMTRMFHRMTGMPLRQYLRRRRLAFALRDVRDSKQPLLDVAVRYGFSSHEAFTRAFKDLYGLTPKAYRQHPVPVVLHGKINPLDRYLLGKGEIGMVKSDEHIKIYRTKVPAHIFLHIKNYESNGYFDFWERQASVPGQDCDTICGLLDSITGKLDGDDSVIGRYSGQIMGYIQEADGRCPEAYGVRLPAGWVGTVPQGMLLLEVPEGEYMVFEHGPFDFESEGAPLFEQLERSVSGFDWTAGSCRRDARPGRVAYYYNDPERFIKRVLPIQSA